MAAYHWEARRKQTQLERRQQERRALPAASEQQDVLGMSRAKASPPPAGLPQGPALQEAMGCTCNTAHVPQNSGKLLKRYTTTEYFQQW